MRVVPEDLCEGLALLERGSRTLDREVEPMCWRPSDDGRFDDGIEEVTSPDGEYTGESLIHWYKTRDEDEESIAPWE